MTQEEIKKECELLYAVIETSKERLKVIRSECQHPNTYEGNYSWRVGCIEPATICSDCGALIKIHHEMPEFTTTSTNDS